MSQQDVLNVLKKNKRKWMSCKDIREILKLSPGSVTKNIARLRIYKLIQFKETIKEKNKRTIWIYKWKAK